MIISFIKEEGFKYEKIHFTQSDEVTNEVCLAIASECPYLTELMLPCTKITDDALSFLAQHCKGKLREIEVKSLPGQYLNIEGGRTVNIHTFIKTYQDGQKNEYVAPHGEQLTINGSNYNYPGNVGSRKINN